MLTEREAKTKWCPHARHPLHDDGFSRQDNFAVNRPFEWGDAPAAKVFPPALCIASDCMAWRWSNADNLLLVERIRQRVEEDIGSDGRRAVDLATEGLGYCGLAGRIDP
jgi:hypothetical protein